MSRPQRHFGTKKRTRKDLAASATMLLVGARDLDLITPEHLVRCYGVRSLAEGERMIADEQKRRAG